MTLSDAAFNNTVKLLKGFTLVGQTSSLNEFAISLGKITGWNTKLAPHQQISFHNYSGIRKKEVDQFLTNTKNVDTLLYDILFGKNSSKVIINSQLV